MSTPPHSAAVSLEKKVRKYKVNTGCGSWYFFSIIQAIINDPLGFILTRLKIDAN